MMNAFNQKEANEVIIARNQVDQVVATLAIENMYMSADFKNELLLIAQGKKFSKEVLAELDKKYQQEGF